MPIALTPTLEIAYTECGPATGYPVILLHGWPDSPATWNGVAPKLTGAGYRVIIPTLRGYGATRFRDPIRPRAGYQTALGRDVLDLADTLEVGRFTLVGHDWGGRAVFPAAILAGDRLDGIASLSVPWFPAHAPAALTFEQAQAFWYQLYLSTTIGEAGYRGDPAAFEKRMWDTWSPPGWYTQAAWDEVERVAADCPDHVATVLHFYQSRWCGAPGDPAYQDDDARIAAARTIQVPALVIHGGRDRCTLPAITEGMGAHFTSGLRREVIDSAGHFPQREAPEETAASLLRWLSSVPRNV